MKQELFEELAKKWERDGKEPDAVDGDPKAEVSNAKRAGYRHGLRDCAADVTTLIELLGEHSLDLVVGRLNRDKKLSIAHALMHLESNHIADDEYQGDSGWYCGNREQFVNLHKKAIALLRSFLTPNEG